MEETIEYGKQGIYAKVLKHSFSAVSNTEILTIEGNFPRVILPELNTHRMLFLRDMLSKNLQSSRAVPVSKSIKEVKEQHFIPVHFGENQKGMTAAKEVDNIDAAKAAWQDYVDDCVVNAEIMNSLGMHKQIVNRALEPLVMSKAVITATDWNNLFHLRYHPDAQPEAYDFVKCIYRAKKRSIPTELNPGEYHAPYVNTQRGKDGVFRYFDQDENEIDMQTALKISSSCCAQVSYRILNQSVEKAEDIHNKLIKSQPSHFSPLEHQATPMNAWDWCKRKFAAFFIDDEIALYKGNLRGFISYRKNFPWENLYSEFNAEI